jgi:uroporphyrinogen decarboxylase
MKKIIHAPETMTSRERVRRTFAFEKTDRVPIGLDTNRGINQRLGAALGAKNGEELRQAVGVDVRGVYAAYTGPLLFEPVPGRNVHPLLGCHTRWIEHETGGYDDYCDFPLKDATDEQFDQFPVPNPDHFDYAAALESAKSRGGQYALRVGDAGYMDVINTSGFVMGMEDALCHLILEDEAALRYIRRRVGFQLGYLERLLEKCKGHIDFVFVGEDLGTQIAPIISMELYRKILRPLHQQFIELAAAHGLPVLVHTCGSSSWVYEDFIEMGVRGVDTLQPEAADMSPASLAARFGGRLNFRGCISTAGPLAYGTPDEVRAVCAETLQTMMPHRGYHFASTHAIQDNSPTENVLAMYQAAHDFGRY